MVRILQAVNIMDRAGLETMLMNYYRHIDRDRIQFDFLTHRSQSGAFDEEIANSKNPVQTRNEMIAEYKEKFASPYMAAARGYVDDVIEPALTRPRLISALEMLMSKREDSLSKKHGNIPM